MRGRTLDEQRYGPGFRPWGVSHVLRVLTRCAVAGCGDPVSAIVTLYVDDHPPALDWYTRLINTLDIGADTEVGFCQGHAQDVVERDEEFMMDTNLWAPDRLNPPVIPSAIKAV